MRDFSTSSVASYGGGSSVTGGDSGSVGSIGSASGVGEAGELLQNIARAMSTNSAHSGGSRSRTASAASGGAKSRTAPGVLS